MKKYIVIKYTQNGYGNYPIAVFYNLKKARNFIKNRKDKKDFYLLYELNKNGKEPYYLSTVAWVTK